MAERDTERDRQHLLAFDHAAWTNGCFDSYIGEFAEPEPVLGSTASSAPARAPRALRQAVSRARPARDVLWRLTSVHSPAHQQLLGETMQDSHLLEDPLPSEQEAQGSEQVLPRPEAPAPGCAPGRWRPARDERSGLAGSSGS